MALPASADMEFNASCEASRWKLEDRQLSNMSHPVRLGGGIVFS
jgi:hypothetical protein